MNFDGDGGAFFGENRTFKALIEVGNERKSRFSFEQDKPDILAVVTYARGTKDARKTPVTSGYRPVHQVTDVYLTSGEHIYFENDLVCPGESAQAYIKFVTPEAYPNCLWIGQRIIVKEGSRSVGEAMVKEIYNKQLQVMS